MNKQPFPSVIGICGYARSGKDTLAQILVKNHGYERVAFADKLKEFALQANPILEGRVQVYPPPKSMKHIVWGDPLRLKELVRGVGWESAKEMAEVRETLQRVGVAARDVLGYDVWVNAAFKDLSRNHRYVFTDVRFGNEASAIRSPFLKVPGLETGQLWRINRPGVGPANSHRSETEMDAQIADFVFENDKDVEHLEHMVSLWAQHYTDRANDSLSMIQKFDAYPLNTDRPPFAQRPQPLDVASKPLAHA